MGNQICGNPPDFIGPEDLKELELKEDVAAKSESVEADIKQAGDEPIQKALVHSEVREPVKDDIPAPWMDGPVAADSKDGKIEEMEKKLEDMEEKDEQEYAKSLEESRQHMKEDPGYGHDRPANRYGSEAELPPFETGKHIPVIALLNPMSGAMAGFDIMQIVRRSPYYQDRFFNIIDVVKGQRRGGLMDVFRIELNRAKDEAKALGTRPRLISGGGDGTGSFAVFILFLALKANPERAEDGLADTGNGFIWTDEEMAESFPALAQMPLGSANDFGNILGWGQKYPGDRGCRLCTSREGAAASLSRWIAAAINPASPITNFDIWGIMPANGEETCNFKIAELCGRRGPNPNKLIDGVRHLQLKEAGKPVPFFVMLYFSTGFGAYMTARFQINRRSTPLKNRAEYTRQAVGIIREPPPPQMYLRLNNIEIDCETEPYFPPRRDRGVQGRGYREVGFYNVNWQAHLLHGADRASVSDRLFSSRQPVRFNDGFLDMYRWKFASLLKNPGPRVQTDKKKDLLLTFKGEKGKGVFFQWDGEARFAFSPTGSAFNIFIRKVLNIPVVLGPYLNERLTGPLDNGNQVRFDWGGDTQEEKETAKRRVLMSVRGELDKELIATAEEIASADLQLWEVPVEPEKAPVEPAAEQGKEAEEAKTE